MTLRLRIHFPYLSQPSVSKTCSFINSRIHLSPFWAFGKIFTAFTLQVYTHFFFKNPLFWSMNLFQRKVGSHLFFKSMPVFQLDNLFSFSPSFFLLAFFFLICSLFLFTFFSFLFHFLSFSIFIFIMIFVCFTYIFLDDVPKRKTLYGSRISNIIDSNDI